MSAMTGGAPELGYAGGCLLDIPDVDYHSIKRFSKSLISGYRSPRHLAWKMENGQTEKEAFHEGRAFHVFCLEPELFDQKVAIRPTCQRRSNEDKATHARFEADNTGKALITAEYHEKLKRMLTGMQANPEVMRYLAIGKAEHALFWTDRLGLDWKMKMDWITEVDGQLVIVDLKKTGKGADAETFRKEVVKYGYHWQDYLYREGFLANFGVAPRFVFVAVEDFDSCEARVYELDTSFTAAAQRHIEPIRAELASLRGLDLALWPGYPAETVLLDAPAWA